MRIVSIIGCGRSGSTLLESVMQHRFAVTGLGEVTFIWEKGWIKDELCGCGRVFRDCEFWSAVLCDAFGTVSDADARRYDAAFRSARGQLRSPALAAGRFPEPSALFTQVAGALYASASKIGGNRPLIDSSKSAAFAASLHRARIGRLDTVHMFRNACGNVHSLRTEKERPHAATPDYSRLPGSKTLLHAIARWKLLNEQAQQFTRQINPATATISYERFCEQPERHMTAIADSFGLSQRSAGGSASWHSVSGNPMRFEPDASPISVDDRWKSEMGGLARAITGLLTGRQERRLDAAADRWMKGVANHDPSPESARQARVSAIAHTAP